MVMIPTRHRRLQKRVMAGKKVKAMVMGDQKNLTNRQKRSPRMSNQKRGKVPVWFLMYIPKTPNQARLKIQIYQVIGLKLDSLALIM